ncbi:MAG: MBOAT family protein [Deinococcota bacterium]
MVFSSQSFLFLFLPLFLGVYYLLSWRAKSAWIFLGSLLFYAWWRVDMTVLFVLTMVWTYLVGIQIHKRRHNAEQVSHKQAGKAWLALGVSVNLGILGYFKYANFIVNNVNTLQTLREQPLLATPDIILPIGISFYIFQATSYLIDVFRKDAPPATNFWDLSAFIALFPQLIAGPILRYKDLAAQFRTRDHNLAKFAWGCRRFMIGFCKKVLLADAVAPLVALCLQHQDEFTGLAHPTFLEALIGSLAYSIQLYFDFAGYSDMAIGLGLMMGFRFMENFAMPYHSRSITEFWQRWHISLSRWLRDYLYIPLGGNRLGYGRTLVNLLIVMLLGGLWHGANWTFVLWGAWHGGLLVLERVRTQHKQTPEDAPVPARNQVLMKLRTFGLVLLGWVMFQAPSVRQAGHVYAALLGQNGFAISDDILWQLPMRALATLVIGLSIVVLEPIWVSYTPSPETASSYIWHKRDGWLVPIFVMALLALISASYSPFLYFQF